jgi:oligopeptide transport system permease protein
MFGYIIRRLLIAIPTLFLIVAMAFFMMRAAPGNPYDTDRKLPPEVEKNIKAYYGLDKPLPQQFLDYVGKAATGDFGPSLKYKDKRVSDIIGEGLPLSATIGVSAIVIAALVGLALGSWAALRQNTMVDYGVMTFAMFGICIPTFVVGPMLILFFALKLGWLPAGTRGDGEIEYLILPILTLALPQIAIISRLVRAGMVEVLRSNYIRTARAKGLSEGAVVVRHALRAAVLPLISYLGPAFAGLITGSLVVEQIYQLPGLGKSFVIGALQRDYTVVMGVVILYASLIMALNLLADLIYGLLDPRVKYE